MELAELLEREGLDPDALMTWARGRADTLVDELASSEHGQPLLQLLVAEASVDVGALSIPRAVEVAQPISVDELPPPPEPQLAEGEPEPILETFDTGPIDLETPEAAALIAAVEAAREHTPEPSTEAEPKPAIEAEPTIEAEPSGEDELEEIELDELVEIAEDELEVLDELDDPEDPLPPRRPPPPEPAPIRTGDTASFAVVDQAPVRTGDTAAHSVVASGDDELEDVDLDAPPTAAADDDGFDLDLDSD